MMRFPLFLSSVSALVLCGFVVCFPLVTGPFRWESNHNTYWALLGGSAVAVGLLLWRVCGLPLTWTPLRRMTAILSAIFVLYAMGLLAATFGSHRLDLVFFVPLSLGVLVVLLRPDFLESCVSRSVRLSLTGFLVVTAGTCLLTSHQHLALFGSYFRRTGFLTLLGCVVLFLAVVSLLRTYRDRDQILLAVVCGGLLVSLVALGQFFDPAGLAREWFPYLETDPRAMGTMGQANWFATYLCLIFPLAVAFFLAARSANSRVGTALGCGVIFAALLVCQTRGAWVAVGCFLLWLVFVHRHTWRRLVPLMAVLALVTAVLLPCKDWKIFHRAISFGTEIERAGEGSSSAGSSRFGYWAYGFKHLPAHLLLGAGLDTYEAVGLEDEDPPPIDKAHSIYLEYAIALGLAGLALYLAFLWACIPPASTLSDNPLTWGFRATILTYLIQGIFIQDTIQSWPVLWVILGLAAWRKIPLESGLGTRNNVARVGNSISQKISSRLEGVTFSNGNEGITKMLRRQKLRKYWGHPPAGFTLIELLLVIAVIGIMSALVVTALSNASGDAHAAMARQQQAVMQEALNAWIAGASSGSGNSLSSAMTTYNGATNKLSLISPYLDPLTSAHMNDFTVSADVIQSEAMAKIGQKLQFSAWASSNYPMVQMTSVE